MPPREVRRFFGATCAAQQPVQLDDICLGSFHDIAERNRASCVQLFFIHCVFHFFEKVT
jgi:hypothetical protein